MSSDVKLHLTGDELRKMDLGALKSTSVLFDDPVAGTRIMEYEFDLGTVHKTEWYAADDFIEAVTEERNASEGDRFGDMRRVATIPMHIWAREIAPRQSDGNTGSIKRWLNSDRAKAFRTFKGKV